MKTKTLLIAFAFLLNSSFLINNCESQWVQFSYGIGNNKTVNSFAIGSLMYTGTETGVYEKPITGLWDWSLSGLSSYDIRSLAISGNNIYAGTWWNSGIYRSTNNGVSWSITAKNSGWIYSLATSGSDIFAGTWLFGVYYSSNNGNNWTQTSTLNVQYVYSLSASGNIVYAGTESGVYLYNGFTWYSTGLIADTRSLVAVSTSNAYAGTVGLGVFYTSDYGEHWSQIGLSGKDVRSLVVSGSNIFAGILNGGIFLSTDSGLNWTEINQGFNPVPSVNALIISNDYVYAGTQGKSVWRRPLSEIGIGIQNISTVIPSKYSLFQNYPNPFNPETNIKFSIPKSSSVKISIFDISGREVETLVNEKLSAGTYQADWNASNFSSGVYFYKITAGDYGETKRMLLVK